MISCRNCSFIIKSSVSCILDWSLFRSLTTDMSVLLNFLLSSYLLWNSAICSLSKSMRCCIIAFSLCQSCSSSHFIITEFKIYNHFGCRPKHRRNGLIYDSRSVSVSFCIDLTMMKVIYGKRQRVNSLMSLWRCRASELKFGFRESRHCLNWRNYWFFRIVS